MKKTIILGLLAISTIFSACEKFLDEKPDQKLVVISTIKDLQALLDNNIIISEADGSASEASADNHYITYADYLGLAAEGQRRLYIWEKDNIFQTSTNDWSNAYRVVYYANSVLENGEKITFPAKDQSSMNSVMGQAYYHRAKEYFTLAQTFALVYDPSSSNTDLGIALREGTNFNVPSVRSSNEETYQQIISDLKKSLRLLPDVQINPLRPSKPAAYGYLSRVYLSMNKFAEAKLYADSCLAYPFKFLDFNTLNATLTYPIARFGPEVVHDNLSVPSVPISVTIGKVAPELYSQFAPNDLRKTVFFRSNTGGTYTFKGSYLGSNGLFSGIAIDEVYLTRAECLIRAGNVAAGLKDLNALLINRFKTGTYVPYSGLTQSDALALVLTERRKELMMRCLRWTDIKRLNKLNANIILKRDLNGTIYTLMPNSPRYALPLPEEIIAISGMPQNPR